MAKKLQYIYPMLIKIKRTVVAVLLFAGMWSCANNEAATTDSTQTKDQVKDTNHLITDSVEVPDTNTAEIDEMKKRN